MNEKIFISPENLAHVYNKIKKETFKYKGVVGDKADLPTTHSVGDAYYIDGTAYNWNIDYVQVTTDYEDQIGTIYMTLSHSNNSKLSLQTDKFISIYNENKECLGTFKVVYYTNEPNDLYLDTDSADMIELFSKIAINEGYSTYLDLFQYDVNLYRTRAPHSKKYYITNIPLDDTDTIIPSGSANKWVISDGTKWIDLGNGSTADLSDYYNKEKIDYEINLLNTRLDDTANGVWAQTEFNKINDKLNADYLVIGDTNTLDLDCTSSIVTGKNNNVSGNRTEVIDEVEYTGGFNAVFGVKNTLYGTQTIISGKNNKVGTSDENLYQSAVFGADNVLSEDANQCLVIGYGNNIKHAHTGAFGIHLASTNSEQLLVGRYNDTSKTGYFVIGGKGSSDGDRKNVFRVDTDGKIYASNSSISNGADYAEYFEWEDGNVNNEIRIGRFVTLSESSGKIKLATNNDDFILGVISAQPFMLGNGAEDHWHLKYMTNVYGEYLKDENDNLILNPDYNDNQSYIPRSERSEWAPVGLLGQLVVDDDGTCIVGKYCLPSVDGIATAADTGYRVLQRLDSTHVKILFK